MNKILFTLVAAAVFCFGACAQKNEPAKAKSSRALVVYFSATGTTAKAARAIADATGGDCLEIVPEKAYTAADLDWNDKQSRSTVEMEDAQSRPAMKQLQIDWSRYDVVYLGYPIWWDQAPRIVNTFLESYDLKGKTVIPFATSGGSGIGNSVRRLKESYPDIRWQDGKLLNGASAADVREWVDGQD